MCLNNLARAILICWAFDGNAFMSVCFNGFIAHKKCSPPILQRVDDINISKAATSTHDQTASSKIERDSGADNAHFVPRYGREKTIATQDKQTRPTGWVTEGSRKSVFRKQFVATHIAESMFMLNSK